MIKDTYYFQISLDDFPCGTTAILLISEHILYHSIRLLKSPFYVSCGVKVKRMCHCVTIYCIVNSHVPNHCC